MSGFVSWLDDGSVWMERACPNPECDKGWVRHVCNCRFCEKALHRDLCPLCNGFGKEFGLCVNGGVERNGWVVCSDLAGLSFGSVIGS